MVTLTLRFSPSALRRLLVGTGALVCLLGLAAEVVRYRLGVHSRLLSFFSLSYEGNFPTWYSSMLLFSCGVALELVALRARRDRAPYAAHWTGLGLIFFYLSLDELAEIHENLSGLFHFGGVLHFGWIVPVAGLLLVLGLVYLKFLWNLARRTRWRFVVAAVLYVGGALLVELPLGWWTERAGDDNLVYGLIDFVEESLEIFGATVFFLAIVDHLVEASA